MRPTCCKSSEHLPQIRCAAPAQELDINKDDARAMIQQLRQGIVERRPPVELSGEVECDEVYVVAGHKGHPEATLEQGRAGRRRRLKGAPGRGTLDKEKPPIFGMIQRAGEVVIQMLANVQQQTIQPVMRQTIQAGTLVFTDEYAIYNRLE